MGEVLGLMWKIMIRFCVHSETGPQFGAYVKNLLAVFRPASVEHTRDALFSTATRRLTTGIRSEKRVVRRVRRCANVIECTYTNLDSTV